MQGLDRSFGGLLAELSVIVLSTLRRYTRTPVSKVALEECHPKRRRKSPKKSRKATFSEVLDSKFTPASLTSLNSSSAMAQAATHLMSVSCRKCVAINRPNPAVEAWNHSFLHFPSPPKILRLFLLFLTFKVDILVPLDQLLDYQRYRCRGNEECGHRGEVKGHPSVGPTVYHGCDCQW